MARTGVLIVATGGPGNVDGVEGFLKAARGVDPTPEALEGARRRLLAIGGVSPAAAVAERVAAALELALNGLLPKPVEFNPVDTLTAMTQDSDARTREPVEIRVLVGMRAARPTIIEALEAFKADGVERVVAVELAPFETPADEAANREAVIAVAGALSVEVVPAGDFQSSEKLAELLVITFRDTIDRLLSEHSPVIVFTAKAVPVDEASASGYSQRIEEAVVRMAALLDLGPVDPDGLEGVLGIRSLGGPGAAFPWLLAYQSGEPVDDAVGPDLFKVVDAAKDKGFSAVGVLPIGLAFDDVETMWTIDILAADKVLDQEMEFDRAGVANDNPALIEAMEAAVREVL
jgi:protoheme ferro-lyase